VTASVDLLERAIGYALGSVALVRPELMGSATPCQGWDLSTLLRHLNSSIAALHEGVHTRHVDAVSVDPGRGADPVADFRTGAGQLLGAWTATGSCAQGITIVDRPLAAAIVADAGAIEIAVHAWDISRACRRSRPIPPGLARDLLELSTLLVTSDTRQLLFGRPVAISALAGPSDRLVAYLGRTP